MELKFDIKAKAEEIVEKLKKDPALLKRVQDDPIKTLETLTGIDLPDEQLKPVVAAVKAKLATADLGDVLGAVKGLF